METKEVSEQEEFRIFKEALTDENAAIQLQALKNLASVAELLGEETTRNQLLPYVLDNMEWNDENLVQLAKELSKFIRLVGGYSHSKIIFEFLKKISEVDEPFVREATMNTFKSIGKDLDTEQCELLLYPVVKFLVDGEWFTKCIAVALFTLCYPKVSTENQSNLRDFFRKIIENDSPVIRKSGATSLVEFLEVLDEEQLRSEVVQIFEKISNDPIDSVRITAVEIAIALSKRLPEEDVEELVFKTVKKWCVDPSWRMRQRLAYSIHDVITALPYQTLRIPILTMYNKLVHDEEVEVQIVAAENLFKFTKRLKETFNDPNDFQSIFIKEIKPLIVYMTQDPVGDSVRLAISTNILSLGSVLSKDCFASEVLPEVLRLLEYDKQVCLKTNILENLYLLPDGLDITSCFGTLIKAIKSMVLNSDFHWRTRRSVLLGIVHITKFCSCTYFIENLRVFYLCLISDPFFAIRRTAPIILPILSKTYGIESVSVNIIPFCLHYKKDPKYLHRYIPLFCLNELMKPTLDVNNNNSDKYLKDLVKMATDQQNDETKRKICLKLLHKLMKLYELVRSKASRPIIDEATTTWLDDPVELYAEETLEALRKHYNTNFYGLAPNELSSPTYLEGVLLLLYHEFLDLVKELMEDQIENIRTRANLTMITIRDFLKKIDLEFVQLKVLEALASLTREEMNEVEEELEGDLKKVIPKLNDESMDLDWMDSLSINEEELPDLGGEIPELEIVRGEEALDLNNNKESEEKS